MFLLLLITFLCSIIAFSNIIAKPIIKFLKSPGTEERQILRQIYDIKKQLSTLSMRDQYVQYVKTERKIIALEKNLSKIRENKIGNNFFIDYIVKIGVKAILSLILLVISIYYRTEPLVILGKEFDVFLLGSIASFPTGIEGAISVPFWIFVTSFTLRIVTKYLRVQ